MALSSLPDTIILPVLLGLVLGLGWLMGGPARRLAVHCWCERLLLWIILGVVTFSWVGVFLAALDLFRWPLVCGALGMLALIAWVYRRRWRAAHAGGPLAWPLDETAPPVASFETTPLPVRILVFIILGAAAWLYAQPAESFFLVDDSAVYTIGGVLLARTGSLIARPEVFWRATEDFVHQFMAVDPFLLVSRHYGPFYQWTAGQTSVEIGFLPLPKVWMALTTWLWGAARATWATSLFGVLGLAALYGLVRRQIGWLAGLITILLLAVSLPQLWFARYPLSEVYTQTFLLAGLYLAVLTRQNAANPSLARWLAFWSALTLAGLTLLRFEAILLLALLAIFLLLSWQQTPASEPGVFLQPWLLTLILASSYGLAIAVGLTRHYFLAQSLAVLTPNKVRIGLIALGILSLVCVWLWPRRTGLRARIARLSGWLPGVYFGILVVWVALAAWQLLTRDRGASLSGWLVQYWTSSGVVLGAAGVAWLMYEALRGRHRPEVLALLGLGIVLLIGYGINPAVNPVHPWAARRLVPVALPVLALGAGTLLAAGFEPLSHPRTRPAARRYWQWMLAVGALVLFPLQLLLIGRVSWPLWGHQELGGFYRQVAAIADRLPPDAVLLFDNGQIGERLTQVFEFVFERPSLSIRATPATQATSAIDTLIAAARGQGRHVFLAITDGNLTWNPDRWQFVSRGADAVAITLLRPVTRRPPDASDIVSRTLWLDLYEILPTGDPPRASQLPLVFPVGAGSYPYFNRGFWNWTLDDNGHAFRWTDGNGVMELPWPEADLNQRASACLILQVAGGRPENIPVQLTVAAEGVRLFQGQLAPGYEPQILRLPFHNLINRDSTALQVTLASGTWTPDGDKSLGVLVRELQLTDLTDCAQ